MGDFEQFNVIMKDLESYTRENKRAPPVDSKDESVKRLGLFAANCNLNYDPDISLCDHYMKDKQHHDAWTEFVGDKGKGMFPPRIEEFSRKVERLRSSVKETGEIPSVDSKTNGDMAIFVKVCCIKYNTSLELSKGFMRDKAHRAIWESFISDHVDLFLVKK